MIASLFGTIKSLKLDQLVIDVNGVGYLVNISSRTSGQLSIGRDAQIHTSMVVREDSLTLFGFLEVAERELFELLQTVSGIGPKVALAITQAMEISDLASAVKRRDEISISAIPGIGKKSAQRMILELEGKLDFAIKDISIKELSWREEVIDALVGLGFSRRQAESALNDLAASASAAELSALSSSERLKLALNRANSNKGLAK
jgi:holliday junction DNA helicase RuvA